MKYYVTTEAIYKDGSKLSDDCCVYMSFDIDTSEFYVSNNDKIISGIIEGDKAIVDACSDIAIKSFTINRDAIDAIKAKSADYKLLLFDLLKFMLDI